MKKIFFFRSQLSKDEKNAQASPVSSDKQVFWENSRERVQKSRINNRGSEDLLGATPCLRRSLSFSSGSLPEHKDEWQNHRDLNGSPCSNGYYSHKRSNTRSRPMTPERQTNAKCFDTAMVKNTQKLERSDCVVSRTHSDMSDISSYCSSKVLDRYIDGEQMDKNESKAFFSTRNQFKMGNTAVKRPPRNLHGQTVSPHDGMKQKPKSKSFRETKVSPVQLSSGEWDDDGFCNESPRELAKHVVERLSQSQFLSKTRSTEFDPDNPITIEDIYSRSSHGRFAECRKEISPNHNSTDSYSDTPDGSCHEEYSEFSERVSLFGKKDRVEEYIDDVDLELFKRFKDAEDRAAILSEELDQEKFLQGRGLRVPVLIQTIRCLTEEKANMALEVSAVLQERIADKALFREQLKDASAGLGAQTRRLEKEKSELQLTLEKELDRRSSEWSLKLEKYQAEEHRLRERVRELAEQNVSLQKEVSSFTEKEMDTRSKISTSEKQLEELSIQLNEDREQNYHLQKTLSELHDKCKASEEGRDCIRRNYEEKIIECKDMHRAIGRLHRTCTEQEKTIEGLQGLCEELGKKISRENIDFECTKLQIEYTRLTRVEHALRKEIESYRAEVDSLRHENIDLLIRLKNNGEEGTFPTFSLDRELQNRISCMQNQVLPLLMESSQIGRKLLEYIKTHSGNQLKNGPVSDLEFDGQLLVESEVKLQALQRAAENLSTCMQTMSSVLHEKSSLLCETVGRKSQTHILGDESHKQNDQKTEEKIRAELKAETLLTSLLREKLYSKELDLEQLQTELAAAVRSNDILKCEVQNAMDNFSCVNHKLKDLELQMIRKDETINQLQADLQECKKESAVVRGVLQKVSEERDVIWNEVKLYSEKNMLLNSEIIELRKKIEALDEDILVKEGQITILKDSISKPFNLLGSPDSTENICW